MSSADGGSISCHRTLCSAVKIWGEGKGEIIGFMASVLPSNHELSLYQSISLAFLLFLPSSTGEWNEQEAVWVFGSWPGSTNIAFQQQLFLDVSCCQGKMTHQLPSFCLSGAIWTSYFDSLLCCIFLLKSFQGEVVFNIVVVIVMSVDTFEKMKGKQATIF